MVFVSFLYNQTDWFTSYFRDLIKSQLPSEYFKLVEKHDFVKINLIIFYCFRITRTSYTYFYYKFTKWFNYRLYLVCDFLMNREGLYIMSNGWTFQKIVCRKWSVGCFFLSTWIKKLMQRRIYHNQLRNDFMHWCI